MLTKVTLQSSNPMELKVRDADPNELVVLKSISGLSPSNITLFTGEFARSGGYYQGRRVSGRNPVMTLRLNADYANDVSVSDIRNMLYRQFFEPRAASDGLQVVLHDDKLPDRYFVGYVESFEADMFVKETDVQVSMKCVDPFLYSTEEQVLESETGWIGLYLDYDGTADSGFQATIQVRSAVPTVTLKVAGDTSDQLMTLTGPFERDDEITINTQLGSRYIRVNGVDSLNRLSTAESSGWIYLAESSNILSCWGKKESDGAVAITKVSYRSAWWGI